MMAHIIIHCIIIHELMSHSKHPPVRFPAPSMYKCIVKRKTTGLGKYGTTGVVYYLGTGPKALLVLYKALARELELS